MFGTIARFHPKAGHEAEIRALTTEWSRSIRPTVPGLTVQLEGESFGRPGELVTVILTRDERTYRALAASPEQDAWYRRLREHLTGDPVWDDVTWESVRFDAAR